MPVIVVGADTAAGEAVIAALLAPEREVRAFVSDPGVALRLKKVGVKVALGDVSDASHLAGAALNCFSMVCIEAAATDERDRAFADDRRAVLEAWAEAASDAGVRRVIWVTRDEPPTTRVPEAARVDPGLTLPDLARRVAELDDAAEL